MFVQTLCLGLVRRIGALLLGGIILWQVAEHAVPSRGCAIIHVSTPRVDLIVDDESYWVESLVETPIVCELSPGRHTVRMLRSGRVLYEEQFAIAAGQELILTAWDGLGAGRDRPWGQ